MKTAVLDLALVPLILGCSAPASTAQEPRPAAQGQDFRPIRFGDPEPLAYGVPFFPGAKYDARVPTPDGVLGQAQGTRLSHHAELLACLRAMDGASERLRVETFA